MPLPAQSTINPDADRRLNRISLGYGLLVFVLLVLTQVALSLVNARVSPDSLHGMMKPWLVVLNMVSILVVLVPFYFGIQRLYAARLEIGRERVAARAWPEAVAALEPFDSPLRWLLGFLGDTDEAHFLLAQSYAALGDKTRADRARAFVRRKPRSTWAARLNAGKGSAAPGQPGQENRPRPSKGKPRRRF